MLRALRGEYVLPEAGGDLLRDGVGVLPTGGLDPGVCCVYGLVWVCVGLYVLGSCMDGERAMTWWFDSCPHLFNAT